MYLQRTAGNQAVQRLIWSAALQAKLRTCLPGDKYEQEADRVADAVMRMPDPQLASSGATHIQRACPACEEGELRRQPIEEEDEEKLQRQSIEEEEEELQAKATSGTIAEVNTNLESHIYSLKGGGQPLSENDSAFFEPRFGRDFSQVRLHTDSRASDAARAVNAKAFTVGKDVVFREGEYNSINSKTNAGKKLLAHELTHVVQQWYFSPTPGMNMQGATEVNLMRKDGQESYIKPTPEIMNVVKKMEAELADLRVGAKPPKSPKVEAARTFCVVKVVDYKGAVKITATGAYLGKGLHAEPAALGKLDMSKIGKTDTILLIVDQLPCDDKCTPIINKFRSKVQGEFRVFTKVKVDPKTRIGGSPKTAALNLGMKGLELMELTEFQKLKTLKAPSGFPPAKPVPKPAVTTKVPKAVPKAPPKAPAPTKSPSAAPTETGAPRSQGRATLSGGKVKISSGGAWRLAGKGASAGLSIWGTLSTIDGAITQIEKAQSGSVAPEVVKAIKIFKVAFLSELEINKDVLWYGFYTEKNYPKANKWLNMNGVTALMEKGDMLDKMGDHLNNVLTYTGDLEKLENEFQEQYKKIDPLLTE